MAGHRLLRDGADNFTKVAVKLPARYANRDINEAILAIMNYGITSIGFCTLLNYSSDSTVSPNRNLEQLHTQ